MSENISDLSARISLDVDTYGLEQLDEITNQYKEKVAKLVSEIQKIVKPLNDALKDATKDALVDAKEEVKEIREEVKKTKSEAKTPKEKTSKNKDTEMLKTLKGLRKEVKSIFAIGFIQLLNDMVKQMTSIGKKVLDITEQSNSFANNIKDVSANTLTSAENIERFQVASKKVGVDESTSLQMLDKISNIWFKGKQGILDESFMRVSGVGNLFRNFLSSKNPMEAFNAFINAYKSIDKSKMTDENKELTRGMFANISNMSKATLDRLSQMDLSKIGQFEINTNKTIEKLAGLNESIGGVQYAFKSLQNNIVSAFSPVIEKLLDDFGIELQGASNIVEQIADKLEKDPELVDKIVGDIEEAGTALRSLVIIISFATTGVLGLVKACQWVGDKILELLGFETERKYNEIMEGADEQMQKEAEGTIKEINKIRNNTKLSETEKKKKEEFEIYKRSRYLSLYMEGDEGEDWTSPVNEDMRREAEKYLRQMIQLNDKKSEMVWQNIGQALNLGKGGNKQVNETTYQNHNSFYMSYDDLNAQKMSTNIIEGLTTKEGLTKIEEISTTASMIGNGGH